MHVRSENEGSFLVFEYFAFPICQHCVQWKTLSDDMQYRMKSCFSCFLILMFQVSYLCTLEIVSIYSR